MWLIILISILTIVTLIISCVAYFKTRKEYFIDAKTFTGPKDGYVFTTKEGKTGYYKDKK
ncbi:hypothetical protein OAK19_00260 [Aureispira]|nr:hypothetical protein [Aureispira sp.]